MDDAPTTGARRMDGRGGWIFHGLTRIKLRRPPMIPAVGPGARTAPGIHISPNYLLRCSFRRGWRLIKPLAMNKPNILYIHSHDTGRHIQPYGYAVVTPNLQRLAEEGVLFRENFCVSPTCSPSRARDSSVPTGFRPYGCPANARAQRATPRLRR